ADGEGAQPHDQPGRDQRGHRPGAQPAGDHGRQQPARHQPHQEGPGGVEYAEHGGIPVVGGPSARGEDQYEQHVERQGGGQDRGAGTKGGVGHGTHRTERAAPDGQSVGRNTPSRTAKPRWSTERRGAANRVPARRPRRVMLSRRFHWSASTGWAASSTRAAASTRPSRVLARSVSRAASFTGSPITVYS